MPLVTYCLVASVLIGLYLSVIAIIHNSTFKKFRQSLDNKQKDIYLNIIRERSNIFYTSIILSLIISGILAYGLFNSKISDVSKLICFFIASTLSLTSLIYLIYPKSDYMIKYLNSDEQRKHWLEINNKFINTKYLGLFLGVIGYFIVANGI